MQAGYEVVAFDLFCDRETVNRAVHCERLDFFQGKLDEASLISKLSTLNFPESTILYGSGFENNPQLLEAMGELFPVLGNSPNAVTQVKLSRLFFPLLRRLDIAFPETQWEPPEQGDGWLIKSEGGSGGTHVRAYDGAEGDYFQRYVEGVPVSLLFLANGKDIEVVGYNEQWIFFTEKHPFCFGGAVSHVSLNEKIKHKMAQVARKISRSVGLRGLNSMDFILTTHGPMVLEVNPRLSATFDLYPQDNLLERHILACNGQISLKADSEASFAQYVCYAHATFTVPDSFIWPLWVKDIPRPDTTIQQGEPLCSISASADNAEDAKSLVFARARQFEAQFYDYLTLSEKQ